MIIYFLCLIPYFSQAQSASPLLDDSVKIYLDKTLDLIEQNALHREDVNWPELRNDIYQRASEAKKFDEILPLYNDIFKRIGDHHGSLKYKGKTYGWNREDDREVNEIIKLATKKYTSVRSEKIGNDIGYIMIPGNNDFRGKHMDSITRIIKGEIAAVHDQNIKGWIVDLRINSGGNMYPMIAGLSDLIGNGKAGGFVTTDHQPDGEWMVKDGRFLMDSVPVSDINYEGFPIQDNLPIAVLVSGFTASSGEMTAIAMIGREQTLVVGERSAGYITINLGFSITVDLGLNLAVNYPADRTGKIYSENIVPDVSIINGDDFDDITNDLKVQTAILLLRNGLD